MKHLSRWGALLCLTMGAALPATASAADAAESYPQRPVTITVGYAPGGGTDIVARLMAKELAKTLGQPFVVENKPGAANNIAVDAVSRAKPDGYTLLLSAVTSAVNQSLYKDLKFDFSKDFAHIAKISEGGFYLVVPPNSPANSPKELADMFRQEPGKHTFASSGVGTSIHATGEMFIAQSKIKGIHVPYRGSSLALTGLMGGETDYMFDNTALPLIQAGKVKALAVSTKERSPHLPDLPTMQEAGYPEFESTWWYGISAPAGTPKPIVDKLNAALMKALQEPEVRVALERIGKVPEPNTPEDYATFIDNELVRWRSVVQAAGMTAQ